MFAWLDHNVLQLGDSLRRVIDAALGTCRYGVILSSSFFEKEWPQRELDGLVAMEAQDRRKRTANPPQIFQGEPA